MRPWLLSFCLLLSSHAAALSLPDQWLHGAPGEPALQVHEAAPGAAYQPVEHTLSLGAKHVEELATATADLGNVLHEERRADFILARVINTPTADKPSIHGMLVAGTDVVYLSHLPMFHSPHNYQLIFEAALPEEELTVYRADAAAHPEALYTLAPTERWVLPDTIREDANFTADLYRGHFERGGVPIARGLTVKVKRIVHFRRFEANGKAEPAQWIAFGRGREQFLAHRIEAAPDMDQVVQVSSSHTEGQSVLLPQAGELKVGDSVLRGKVQRVIYTEYGDLAQ